MRDYFIHLKFFENITKDNDNDEEVVLHCCKLLKYRVYQKNECICKFGDEGNEFYIFMKGRANVIVPVPGERSPSPLEKHQQKVLNPNFH